MNCYDTSIEIAIGRAVRRRGVAWSKREPFGAEFARVAFGPDRLRATGVAIGSTPQPYRLDYELTTGARYLTEEVVVHAAGDAWSRRLELRRSAGGGWTAEVGETGFIDLPEPGGDLSILADALDPDLGLSPLFNTMPVLREQLHERASTVDFLMVWISVPDLSLHPSPQRYTHLETHGPSDRVVRFEAVGTDFVADVIFDGDGLVVDYPGIATRIRAG